MIPTKLARQTKRTRRHTHTHIHTRTGGTSGHCRLDRLHLHVQPSLLGTGHMEGCVTVCLVTLYTRSNALSNSYHTVTEYVLYIFIIYIDTYYIYNILHYFPKKISCWKDKNAEYILILSRREAIWREHNLSSRLIKARKRRDLYPHALLQQLKLFSAKNMKAMFAYREVCEVRNMMTVDDDI